MSTGYQEEEEYEDELYREDEGSGSSGTESEVEMWLYSQLHYSSGLGQREEEDEDEEGQRQGETGDVEGDPAAGPSSRRAPERADQQWSSDKDSDLDPDSDGAESWMILDGEEREEDCNILLNVEFRSSSSSSSSAEDENNADWTVSEKDMEAQNANRRPSLRPTCRYYNPNKSVTCQNCRKTGHFSRACPVPKKCASCLLCGSEGHLQHGCPRRHCPNCRLPGHGSERCPELAYWHRRCCRCGAAGHFHDACPDIWRQYHLTTQTGTLVKPDRMDARRSPAYCYNCARRGHFGFACSQRRMSSGIYPNVPYISHYDTPQDVCQRDSRMQSKAKELQEAGLLVFSADPQGGAREEEPSRKRRNKGGGGKEATGATPSAKKGERLPGRGKTWPEKRKERRQIKKLRREAMAQRAGAMGLAREEEEEEEAQHFLRGHEKMASEAATPPAKGKASPGPFGSGKRSDWKNRKCRDRKCRDRKCRDRKCRDRNRSKGRMQGALKPEDIYPSDENFLPVKRRAQHRKR